MKPIIEVAVKAAAWAVFRPQLVFHFIGHDRSGHPGVHVDDFGPLLCMSGPDAVRTQPERDLGSILLFFHILLAQYGI
jgi:hypothetical protein